MKTVSLAGPDILVRRARLSEARTLARSVQTSLAEVGRFLGWATESYDTAAAREFLNFVKEQEKDDLAMHYSVFEHETGQLIGGVGMSFRPLFQTAELGYWMRTDRAGRGYTTQASELMLHHAFFKLKLRRVYMVCQVENRASRRVAEKLGMRREGRMKEFLVIHDRPRDCYLYALLRGEYKPGI